MNPNLQALHDAGVSIWLDDLSRKKIQSGELQTLIDEKSVSGVTTNPTIFAAAFQDLSQYGAELAALKAQGVDVEAAILVLRDDTSPGPQAESALKVLEAAIGRAIHAVGASQKRCDRVCQDAAAVLDELVEEIGRIRQKKH